MFVVIGQRLGFDKAISINLAKGLWLATSSLLTIIISTKYLDQILQGYFFTIYALIGIQVFVEMGLGFALVQIISHEMGQLKISRAGILYGDEKSKKNIQSIMNFSLRWFMWGGILLFILMSISGIYIFDNSQYKDITKIWVIISLVISINIQINTVSIFLEGIGRIEELAKFKIMQTILSNPILWILLILNRDLYAIVWGSITSLVISITIAYYKYGKSIIDILKFKSNHTGINWKSQILPFQAKIAVSWLSGYLVFNALTPMIFKYAGPIEAGRFGASMQLFALINSGAAVWISTKIPKFGRLIALNKINQVKLIFKKTLGQSTAIILIILIGVMILYFTVSVIIPELLNRFVGKFELLLLLLSCLANHFVLSMAYYLRSFKQEPFMYLSLANGIVTFLIAYILTQKYGALGAIVAYAFGSIFIGLLFGFLIFRKKYG